MMDKHYILAIDQGGQSSRVAVYDQTGKQHCCFSAACATYHYHPENSTQLFIEQHAEEILSGINDCLQKIIHFMGDDIRYIKFAGFAGQGSSLLCWDKNTNKPLTPILSWQDIRGESYVNNNVLTHQRAQQLTGLRCSPHYGASKIRWLLDNNPAVSVALKNNTLCAGPIVTFIFCNLLSDENNIVDPGHAQRTLLWNLHNNHWDDELLNYFSIPKNILPECEFHNSYFGSLSLSDHKIPFVASARDQGASLFSQGLPDEHAIYINIGTGAFIQRVTENLCAPEGLLVSPLWLSEQSQDKKYYAWEATVNGAASAAEFISQQSGMTINPQIISEVLMLDPDGDCYFLNAVGGLSAPYWRTDVQSRFSKKLSPHEIILAWLESVIFQIVVNVELINPHGTVQKIYISGGLSNADAICQKIADLTRIAVHRYENADATLQGIAYLAASMPEKWQANQVDDIFNPQENILLKKRYHQWLNAMQQWLL